MSDTSQHVRLGVFVFLGLLLFTLGIYYLGTQRTLLGRTVTVHSVFRNVQGLRVGNNVRFSGVNVGTVAGLRIVQDSLVEVTMRLERSAVPFVKQDARATVGSEGVVGDKLVNLSAGSASAPSVVAGSTLPAGETVQMEELMATLARTGREAQQLMTSLHEAARAYNAGEGTLGKLAQDTALYGDLETLLTVYGRVGQQATQAARQFNALSERVAAGEGALGQLVADPETAAQLSATLDTLSRTGEYVATLSANLADFTARLDSADGTVNRLLTDTTLADNVGASVYHLGRAAQGLQRTTEALNESWLFRKLTKSREAPTEDTLGTTDTSTTATRGG